MTQCGCGADKHDSTPSATTIAVDLLYVDIDSCDRCQGADAALAAALADAEPVLADLGVGVAVRRILVEDRETAERHRLLTSPTIRIGGTDIQAGYGESSCEACGTVAGGTPVNCRDWVWRGKSYTAPPKGMIVEALLRAALDGTAAPAAASYAMPENLQAFFAGKAAKSGCGCGCGG